MRESRVLVVHPSAELYGSDRVLAESVTALVAAGRQVVVALSAEGPLRAVLEAAGAEVVVVATPVLRKSLLSPRGVLRLAAETARSAGPAYRLVRRFRPAVVYVNTVTVPAWLPLARAAGARVLCHVHEAEEDAAAAVRFGLAAPLLLAHTVVANSEASRDVLIRSLPALRRRIRVIYNGVPGPAEVRPARSEPAAPVRLALVGRISPRKGTDVAVEALALLRERGIDAQLTLVGAVFPGYEWFESQVRAAATAAGIADAVHWAGLRSDIWPELAAADVALVPSRVEPFGNAAVEAMLAGRPVIAGDTQGLREVVTDGRTGRLCRPGDAGALADAVTGMLADWPGALERAAVARETAQQRFGVQRYRDDVVAAVTETAGRGRGGAGPRPAAGDPSRKALIR